MSSLVLLAGSRRPDVCTLMRPADKRAAPCKKDQERSVAVGEHSGSCLCGGLEG